MAKKVYLWLAAAGVISLIASAAIWQAVSSQLHTFITNANPLKNQSAISAIVQDSIHNPDIQKILHAQIMLYMKSAEGREKLAEMMKSPEMVKAMADNIQSPELRPALVNLLQDPLFRSALLEVIREAPEMKILKILDSAIEWNVTPAEAEQPMQ